MEHIGQTIAQIMAGLDITPGMFQTPAHYRAWLAGTPIRTERPKRWRVPARWRESVMRHCGYRCQWCGSLDNPTLEHLVPVVLGGSNQPSNLTVLCPPCQARSWARFAPVLRALEAA